MTSSVSVVWKLHKGFTAAGGVISLGKGGLSGSVSLGDRIWPRSCLSLLLGSQTSCDIGMEGVYHGNVPHLLFFGMYIIHLEGVGRFLDLNRNDTLDVIF